MLFGIGGDIAVKIFQPFAEIEDCLGAKASRYSRKSYITEEEAYEAIPEFLERLERKGIHDLGYADKVLRTTVIKLELVGFYIATGEKEEGWPAPLD